MFGTMLLLPMQGFFNALVYFHSTTQGQPRRNSPAGQATHSSSFFTTPFQSWGSFLRLFSGRHSAESSEPIVAAVAHAAMAQEEELRDSEEEDPGVVARTHTMMPQEEELQDSEEEDPVVVALTHTMMPQEKELQDSEEEDPVVVVEPIESCN
jgi:hypothetical protein